MFRFTMKQLLILQQPMMVESTPLKAQTNELQTYRTFPARLNLIIIHFLLYLKVASTHAKLRADVEVIFLHIVVIVCVCVGGGGGGFGEGWGKWSFKRFFFPHRGPNF